MALPKILLHGRTIILLTGFKDEAKNASNSVRAVVVDDEDNHYYPLSRSPLFLDRTDEFFLDRDEVVDGELLFEIPEDRDTNRLLFDRYQE